MNKKTKLNNQLEEFLESFAPKNTTISNNPSYYQDLFLKIIDNQNNIIKILNDINHKLSK